MTDHLRDRIAAAVGKALDDDPMHTLTDLQHRITTNVLAAFAATGPDREHRIRLDDLTSDDLDRLYNDLDRYCEVVGEMNETAVHAAKKIAEAEQRTTHAETLLRDYVSLANITHKYGAMGGHDSLGENLGCAGCNLRDQARTFLDTEQHPPAV